MSKATICMLASEDGSTNDNKLTFNMIKDYDIIGTHLGITVFYLIDLHLMYQGQNDIVRLRTKGWVKRNLFGLCVQMKQGLLTRGLIRYVYTWGPQ